MGEKLVVEHNHAYCQPPIGNVGVCIILLSDCLPEAHRCIIIRHGIIIFRYKCHTGIQKPGGY